ncbi:transporter substrate-binding domain-containing protein [Desulfobacter curvatus]|uniref:transporter substrate-binding domain-containing protein n=1 Tax=Desulfobacter curvatus TaxID=2290 RepID=UPI000370456C|nr:transporter substrate-binding domain-containing protein [Desulfobacter curvatus]
MTALIMGLSFINPAYSHAQNPGDSTAGTLQLTPAEKSWINKHPIITIAGPRSFPPFHYYEKGKPKGISVDYTTQIAAKLGLQLRIQANLPWSQVLERVRQGDIDLITCIAKTAERETYLDFSEPYLTVPLVIVSRYDSPFIGGLEDLHGKTLAMVSQTLAQEWLSRDKIDFSPLYVQSPLHGLEAVSFSRADAAIENLAAATYLIHKTGLANLKIAAPTPYDNYQLYMAVPKGHQELLTIFNKALAAMSPRQKSDIRNQWLSVKYDYGVNPNDVFLYIILVLLFSVSIIFIVLLRSRRLSKETRERIVTEKALRENEEKLRNILENSTSMYYTHTPDHKITYVSPQCRQILHCEPEEAMTRWTEFVTDNPINLKGFEYTEKAIKTGQRQPPYELELKGNKGHKIMVEIRENPVVENGRTVAIVGSATDITEHKKAEKDKEALQHQLMQARKMESIGTLAGGISHDFNNILGIILGNAQLALLDLPEENPARSRIKEIQAACLRAKDVVLQLLSFSRQAEQKKQLLNPAKLVTDTVRFLRASIPSSIEIVCQTDEPIQTINANPTQVQQVIINLCNNAAQAMEPGGGTLTICLTTAKTHDLEALELKARAATEAIRLTIEDTGTGIDPAIQDRIFDPYFTTKEVGKGSGMGLAIVHGIVHNHGGAISVKSGMGCGTVFTVLFPANPMPPADEEPDDTGPVPGGTESILLVDDEKGLTDMLGTMLMNLGYTVKAGQDPEKALATFTASPSRFDLIITDMTMPRINGLELCAAIKKIRPDIPIIICTGHSSQVDAAFSNSVDIAAVVTKPVTILEIAQTIRKVLD